jgi:tetratricopeptide (TPR) repeat protein
VRRACWALFLAASCAPAAPAPEELALDRYREGDAYFAQGHYDRAVPHFEYVVSARERMKDAHYKLAYCHEAMGRDADATAVLEKVLRTDRQDEYALRHLWRLYLHRGFVDPALDCCRQLAKLYPRDEGLWAEIARLEALKAKR